MEKDLLRAAKHEDESLEAEEDGALLRIAEGREKKRGIYFPHSRAWGNHP